MILTQLVKMASRSFPLRQATRGFLLEHITALVLCTASVFSSASTRAMSRLIATYQGVSRVCALGGSNWEGVAKRVCPAVLTRPSFTNLWESQCSVIALGVRGLFSFLLWARLALRASEVWLSLPWEFQGSSSPSSGRKQLHTHWSDLLLIGGSKLSSFSSCFLTCPLLINSACVLATTEVGTSKGGLEFGISGSVFLLTSQLLPVPVHCLLRSELDWLGYHLCALCRIALISISNYSFYFSKPMSSFQETWDSFL